MLWTVTPAEAINDITPSLTTSTANGLEQTLTFSATKNTGSARSATFTIAVTGGNHPSHQVTVNQAAGGLSVTIDSDLLAKYKSACNTTQYPPFDYDGEIVIPEGCTYDNGVMTGSYTVQVQEGQKQEKATYVNMQKYCGELTENGLSGWRIPTEIELYAIYRNKSMIGDIADSEAFIEEGSIGYWSSTVWYNDTSRRCRLYFGNGGVDYGPITYNGRYVRCVRDK